MKWFRLYTDVLDDPKVQRLPAPLFRTWINLLCLAGKGDGLLPGLADIAFALRLDEDDAVEAVGALTARGLLELVEGTLVPHNWHGRQFASDNVSERVKRFRERARVVPGNDAHTLRETPPDQIQNRSDTEQIRSRAPAREGGAVAPEKEGQKSDGNAGGRAPTRHRTARTAPRPAESVAAINASWSPANLRRLSGPALDAPDPPEP